MNAARPILLVRLPNWVGDVCMALPTLRQLEAIGFAPVLAGRRWAADLLAGHDWPVLALPSGTRAAAAVLRGAGARHGLLLTNSIGSAVAMRWAGVSALGHRNEGRSLLLGRAIAKPTGLHEVRTFWRLGAHLAGWRDRVGWPPDPPESLGLRLADTHRAAAREALRGIGLVDGAPYVVLAPLATGTIDGASKCWPGFGALGRALRERGITTVCCPGPGEEAGASAAVPDARLLPGLGLGAYAAVCAGARLTVSNDSGPMHLAAAVDAEVIGVFGPSDPRRVSPWGPHTAWFGGGGDWPLPGVIERAVDARLAGADTAELRPPA
ncbi:MAG: glycosyltransferase family 9 protein [Burkholderiaceae bacterium]